MQFANKDLGMLAIDQIKLNNDEELREFEQEIKAMPEEKRFRAQKFRDIVKDDVREKFSDILKEVSDELKLPDGDLNTGEAMKEMSATLDQLIAKLAGSSEKMKEIKKQVVDLKQAAHEASDDDVVNLKRDGKRSVKKELRDEDEPRRGDIPAEIDDDADDDFDVKDDAELDAALEEARKKLLDAEAEVEQLEKEWEGELPPKLGGSPKSENVRVSVTKMIGASGGEQLDEEQAAKIAKRLEGTIKDKLAKLGIDTGNRPIEVKLITTSLPEGLALGEEGDPQNDQQVQSMFFNMMTGNIQGYEDIDSQRKAESSYKFHWDENMIEEIESKISSLGGEPEKLLGDAIVVEDDAIMPEEVVLSDQDEFDGLVGVEDERKRPSSKSSKIDDESEKDPA